MSWGGFIFSSEVVKLRRMVGVLSRGMTIFSSVVRIFSRAVAIISDEMQSLVMEWPCLVVGGHP